jgi:hypothetical protein
MAREFKVLYVTFPEATDKTAELWFPSDCQDGLRDAYKFLIKNGADVTNFEGFQDWEIRDLIDLKNAIGDALVQPLRDSKDGSDTTF